MAKEVILKPEAREVGVSRFRIGCWVLTLLRSTTILAVAGYIVGYMAFGANMSLRELLVGVLIAAGVIVAVWCWRVIRPIITLVWRIAIGGVVLWLLFNGL